MRTLLMLIVLCLAVMPLAAQPDCSPTDPRPDDGSCDAVSEMNVIIRTPAWLAEYPNAYETVNTYLSDARNDYLGVMSEEPLRDIPVPLWYEVDYEVMAFSDEVVTIVLTEYINYGGLYPVDGITTFTFDLSEDRELTITDLLREDVRVEDVFPPLIQAVHGEGVLEDLYMADELDNPDRYNTFILSPSTLTLVYPAGRIGPMHAGMLNVEIALYDLMDVLDTEWMG